MENQRKKYILVVEDENIVAWDIQESLERIGYKVLARAASGQQALRIVATMKPDLVLMDIQLQEEMTGLEAARQISSNYGIPVVFLTAHADDRTLEEAAQTNPFGYLVKPFQWRELHTTIQIALRRHELEKNAHAVQQRLSTTIHSIEEAAIATDNDGIVKLINPVAERLTGWQLEAAMGKHINQVLHLVTKKDCVEIEYPGWQAMRLGITVSLPDPCFVRSKDGIETLVRDEAIPVKDHNGEVIGSVVVFHNLSHENSEHRELQQRNHELEEFQFTLISQLQEKNSQLQQALASVQVLSQVIAQVRPSADENQILQITIQEIGRALDADYCWVALHDDQHSISTIRSEYINSDLLHLSSAIGTAIAVQNHPQFYRQLFQHNSWLYPQPSILPLPYQSLLFPGNQALICPIIVDQAPIAGTIDQMVIGEFGILVTGKPLWSEPQPKLISQIVSYAVTIVRQFHVCQVSGEHIANEQMLNFLKEDFISSISAEMRTPLTNMRMALEMFQRIIVLLKNGQVEPVSDSQQLWQKLDQYLHILQTEWQREFHLINDVLNFQSSVNPTTSLTKSEIEFPEWIPQLLNRFWTQVSRQKQILSYHIAPDLPTVFSHPSSLERIVTELLGNACRHTPADQRICISAEIIDTQLELKVTNTGSPIPPQELEAIFQPFYRIPKSNPWNYYGTGLGLALVKKLVLSLGGEIHAESSKQVTTFTVTLPL